jgi:hypothetical protein
VFDLWSALWTLLISSVGTYALTFGIRGPMMPWVVFTFVIGHLSVSQLVRQFTNVPDTVIDNTGSFLPSPDLHLLPSRNADNKSAHGCGSKVNGIRLERLRRPSKYRCTAASRL